jgi:pheromone shutdown protein TraB
MTEILNIDYNHHVNLIGTAHFTRRSLYDAYEAVRSLKPKDVALELDLYRFRKLNTACLYCSHRRACEGICEFVGAAEALGNVDANIWLIDMTEREMKRRIKSIMTPYERSHRRFPTHSYEVENPVWLWERGFKEQVINNSKRQIEANRRLYPSVWRVLIDERNALMAARLAWITSNNRDEEKNPRILTFIGAAHLEGIRDLLGKPLQIKENLQRYNLAFTEPTLIRRVAVKAL